jgi:hypothetical protein
MAGKLTPGKPSKENHRIFPQPVKAHPIFKCLRHD